MDLQYIHYYKFLNHHIHLIIMTEHMYFKINQKIYHIQANMHK